jgi:2-succinyl-5-enolpyruvyl-6-hydroxy-3-cyclohexene-1-carboxylate synthase
MVDAASFGARRCGFVNAANPSHALGLVVTDELARCGVSDVCIAPGSRSAPLAMAFAQDPRMRVHVRIDERSASFVALGLAKASGRPAAVVSTSGTAAANFYPAVIEADHARVPMVVLTADRPPELRATGANQTIDQTKLFGDAVRWFLDVGVPVDRPGSAAYWRSVLSQAYSTACGPPAGPVHLNLPLREPLVPEGDGFLNTLEGRAEGRPWCVSIAGLPAVPDRIVEQLAGEIASTERGLIVAGDTPVHEPEPVLALARAASWPLVAESTSGLRRPGPVVSTYDALLRHPGWADAHRPDVVLLIGRAATSKGLSKLLQAGTKQIVIDASGARLDPTRSVSAVVRGDPATLATQLAKALPERSRTSWFESWVRAEETARGAMDAVMDSHDPLSEPRLARDLAGAMPFGSTLVAASSMPVRDLDWFTRPHDNLRVLGNRGASGIDGFVSASIGVALASKGRVAALAGDLSMLHDSNGLAVEPAQRPDIVFVVANNDGGGIFSFLPQARWPDTFERVFGTPHGMRFDRLADLYRCGYAHVTSAGELGAALQNAWSSGGVHIAEVITDRHSNVRAHREIWDAVNRAVDDLGP